MSSQPSLACVAPGKGVRGGSVLSDIDTYTYHRAEPSRAEPSRAEPSRAEPSRAEYREGRASPPASPSKDRWPNHTAGCRIRRPHGRPHGGVGQGPRAWPAVCCHRRRACQVTPSCDETPTPERHGGVPTHSNPCPRLLPGCIASGITHRPCQGISVTWPCARTGCTAGPDQPSVHPFHRKHHGHHPRPQRPHHHRQRRML
ncbi:hypothetical protein D5041_16810 [Verminephrobacter aporrectodeae subsp. tuberculatae]|nr:hypothetical protein [Verminephrobacter aporrectodeae subsp. tuberculatae]MCW5290639.1 hypothetical protein [Verminephrobacter aporrectodeae subsp. tuberculatae]